MAVKFVSSVAATADAIVAAVVVVVAGAAIAFFVVPLLLHTGEKRLPVVVVVELLIKLPIAKAYFSINPTLTRSERGERERKFTAHKVQFQEPRFSERKRARVCVCVKACVP